jgi:hypothetical protein
MGPSLGANGTVKNSSFVIILELIPVVTSCTCFLMYHWKLSLDHLLNNIIVKTGIPAKYMVMAAPLLAKWKPIKSEVKPSMSRSMESATMQNLDGDSRIEKK